MAVPVHHGYGVTRFDSQAGEPRSEPADALDQRSVVEALHVSVDDVLVRAVRERRMQQVLDEQWVLVRRRRVFDEICGGWLAERRRHRLHSPNSRCTGHQNGLAEPVASEKGQLDVEATLAQRPTTQLLRLLDPILRGIAVKE